MPLTAAQEAGALRETEDAIRELMSVGKTIGLNRMSLASMLRSVADEMDPPSILMPGSDAVQ